MSTTLHTETLRAILADGAERAARIAGGDTSAARLRARARLARWAHSECAATLEAEIARTRIAIPGPDPAKARRETIGRWSTGCAAAAERALTELGAAQRESKARLALNDAMRQSVEEAETLATSALARIVIDRKTVERLSAAHAGTGDTTPWFMTPGAIGSARTWNTQTWETLAHSPPWRTRLAIERTGARTHAPAYALLGAAAQRAAHLGIGVAQRNRATEDIEEALERGAAAWPCRHTPAPLGALLAAALGGRDTDSAAMLAAAHAMENGAGAPEPDADARRCAQTLADAAATSAARAIGALRESAAAVLDAAAHIRAPAPGEPGALAWCRGEHASDRLERFEHASTQHRQAPEPRFADIGDRAVWLVSTEHAAALIASIAPRRLTERIARTYTCVEALGVDASDPDAGVVRARIERPADRRTPEVRARARELRDAVERSLR